MRLKTFAAPALAFTMLASTASVFAAPAPALLPPAGFYQGGWDAPPAEYDQYHRYGFQDGIYGAQQDFKNHRPFTPENRNEYRHPRVPPNVYRDYREAFREGYRRAVMHLTGR